MKVIEQRLDSLIPLNGLYVANPAVLGYNQDALISLPIHKNKIVIWTVGHVANITLIQQYVNITNKELLTRYVFPLEHHQLFLRFVALINQKQITTQIVKKQEVKQGLVNMDANNQSHLKFNKFGLMTIPINESLNPQSNQGKIRIQFSYTIPLKISYNIFWALDIKHKLTPRYLNQKYQDYDNLIKNTQFQYKESMKIILIHHNKIHLPLFSITHSISKPVVKNDGRQVEIKLNNKKDKIMKLNRHFRLLYSTDAFNSPQVYPIGQGENNMYIYSWIPKTNNFTVQQAYQYQKKHKTLEIDYGCVKGEYVIVIDRSGSMNEYQKIQSAKRAIDFFIQHLPQHCTFNIVSFGSEHEFFFEKSQKCNEDNSLNVRTRLKQFTSQMGGTQLFCPLYQIFKQSPNPNNYKYILVFTDGDTQRKQQVLKLVEQNRQLGTVFPIGIGQDMDKLYLQKIAKVGQIKPLFIKQTDNFAQRITQLYSYLFKTVISNIQFDFKINDQFGVKSVFPNPNNIKKVQPNQPIRFFIQPNNGMAPVIQNIGNYVPITSHDQQLIKIDQVQYSYDNIIPQKLKKIVQQYAQKELIDEANNCIKENRDFNIFGGDKVQNLEQYVLKKSIQFQIFDPKTTTLITQEVLKTKPKQVQQQVIPLIDDIEQNKKQLYQPLSQVIVHQSKNQQQFEEKQQSVQNQNYQDFDIIQDYQEQEQQKYKEEEEQEQEEKIFSDEEKYQIDYKQVQQNPEQLSDNKSDNKSDKNGWTDWFLSGFEKVGQGIKGIVQISKIVYNQAVQIKQSISNRIRKHSQDKLRSIKRIQYKPQKAKIGQSYQETDKFINLLTFQGNWTQSKSDSILNLLGFQKEKYERIKQLYASKISNKDFVITIMTLYFLYEKQGRKQYVQTLKKVKRWVSKIKKQQQIDTYNQMKIASLLKQMK